MLPKPPFPHDLTIEQEREAFERLKPRMLDVWDALVSQEDQAHTSVVVPSMTLDQDELRKLNGASFYEERLLFLLIRLRNPRARLVYVTSQPVHPLILEYYLGLLAGVHASHARGRLTMLCAHDASPRSLTQKILERPRLLQRIRYAIHDPSLAYLTVFNSTPLERRLAVLLGIPLNGLDPDLAYLGTKSGSRKIFREAGVDLPAGREDVRTPDEVVTALDAIQAERPGVRRAVIKLNESFSGKGNAIFTYPADRSRAALGRALEEIRPADDAESRDHYMAQFGRMGGIVEEYIEAAETNSPSAQFRTGPRGEVVRVSTHDQILGGEFGQTYLGCSFPARAEHRRLIQDAGLRVGAVLAGHGVVSRFGVDFLVWRNGPDESWHVSALEINLRVVGTTHPFLALQFLTGGHLDPDTGEFLSLSGRPKYYQATDNLWSEKIRGMLPEDLLDVALLKGLNYSHRTESGVLFHLIGALSEFGKLGLTVIGNSPEEARDLLGNALSVLDAESSIGKT